MREGHCRVGRHGGRRLSGDGSILATRLWLVPLAVTDAAEMVGPLADPDLYRITGGTPPTLADLERRYRAQVAGRSPDGTETWRNWIVRLIEGEVTIGFVQATLTDAGHTAEVAWVIGVPWQGHGYATEAARALVAHLVADGVETITAHVHPDHVASERVAAASGLIATDEIEDGERAWRLTRSPDRGSGSGSG